MSDQFSFSKAARPFEAYCSIFQSLQHIKKPFPRSLIWERPPEALAPVFGLDSPIAYHIHSATRPPVIQATKLRGPSDFFGFQLDKQIYIAPPIRFSPRYGPEDPDIAAPCLLAIRRISSRFSFKSSLIPIFESSLPGLKRRLQPE